MMLRLSRHLAPLLPVALLALPAAAKKAPPEPRLEIKIPIKEALAAGKLVVLPLPVVQEYRPCGEDPVDDYLAATEGLWEPLILARLSKQLKGAAVEVKPIAVADARKMMTEVLAEAGIGGFYDPDTGELKEEHYDRAMKSLAAKTGTPLLVPRLILKPARKDVAWWLRIDGWGGSDIEWDGVERDLETGGTKAVRTLEAFGGGGRHPMEGTFLVYSLRVEGYGPSGLLFWSHGGFDLHSKWSRGLFGTDMKEVPMTLGKMFGKKNHDNMEEAVEVALEPLRVK